MKTEQLITLIDEHLQETNSNKEERIKRTKDLIDFLNYNLRLVELSDKEKENFVGSMEGYPLTDDMKKALNDCPTQRGKDYYINMWARSAYFRRCAWFKYLYGETNEKPSIQ